MPWRPSSSTPKRTRGISCLSLCLYGIRIGGFHEGKESIYLSTNSHMKTAEGGWDPVNVLASDGIAAECFFFYFDSLLTFTKWQLEIGGWSVSVWDPDTSSWKSRMTNISSFVMSSWLPCTPRRILFLHWLIMQRIVSWNINGTTYSNFIFERLLLQQILN